MEITIHFLNGNDESIQQHYFQKEYRNDILVEIDSIFYETYFYTQDALKYEMLKDGYFSFPGLIILEEVTSSKIIISIKELSKMNYFDWFVGKKEMLLNNLFLQKWYDNDMSLFDIKSVFSLKMDC